MHEKLWPFLLFFYHIGLNLSDISDFYKLYPQERIFFL